MPFSVTTRAISELGTLPSSKSETSLLERGLPFSATIGRATVMPASKSKTPQNRNRVFKSAAWCVGNLELWEIVILLLAANWPSTTNDPCRRALGLYHWGPELKRPRGPSSTLPREPPRFELILA